MTKWACASWRESGRALSYYNSPEKLVTELASTEMSLLEGTRPLRSLISDKLYYSEDVCVY